MNQFVLTKLKSKYYLGNVTITKYRPIYCATKSDKSISKTAIYNNKNNNNNKDNNNNNNMIVDD